MPFDRPCTCCKIKFTPTTRLHKVCYPCMEENGILGRERLRLKNANS